MVAPRIRPWPLMARMASPWPLVVTRAVLATAPVTRALMPTVVPWASFEVEDSRARSSIPRASAAAAMAPKKPTEKSPGVVETLPTVAAPVASTTMASVKVPPMSTPTMY